MIKHLVVGALLLGMLAPPAMAVNRSRLDGYKDVTFGDTPTQAETKLRKYFQPLRRVNPDLSMFKGTVVGYREVLVFANYQQNRLTRVRFAFSSQQGYNTPDLYFDLVDKLKKVYGQPTDNRYGYYDGHSPDQDLSDDSEPDYEAIYADVLAGKAWYLARWEFSDGNVVSVETETLDNSDDLYVALNYDNPRLRETLKDKAVIEEL
ncbi:hypothetical protein D3C72_642710 [compost metagenome]